MERMPHRLRRRERPRRQQLSGHATRPWRNPGSHLSASVGARNDLSCTPQAESVTYHLSVPVLRHQVFKPSYSCIAAIRTYFSSLPVPIKDEELIVVGDRIFTDVVLANRMSRLLPALAPPAGGNPEKNAPQVDTKRMRVGPLSIWTSGVWQRESMPMRYVEKTFMRSIQQYVAPNNGLDHPDVRKFVNTPSSPTQPAVPPQKGIFGKLWSLVSRIQ